MLVSAAAIIHKVVTIENTMWFQVVMLGTNQNACILVGEPVSPGLRRAQPSRGMTNTLRISCKGRSLSAVALAKEEGPFLNNLELEERLANRVI